MLQVLVANWRAVECRPRAYAGWSRLAQHARLFAIDLPAFGRSEHRTELLSPSAMK